MLVLLGARDVMDELGHSVAADAVDYCRHRCGTDRDRLSARDSEIEAIMDG